MHYTEFKHLQAGLGFPGTTSKLNCTLYYNIVGVGVDDGWFRQPHLVQVRLIGLWGSVRLQPCCSLSQQGAQVKPAITAHEERSPAWKH